MLGTDENDCHSFPLTYTPFTLTWARLIGSHVWESSTHSHSCTFSLPSSTTTSSCLELQALLSKLQGSLEKWMSHGWSQPCPLEGHTLSMTTVQRKSHRICGERFTYCLLLTSEPIRAGAGKNLNLLPGQVMWACMPVMPVPADDTSWCEWVLTRVSMLW